jgi:site-specific DNA recombinase
MKAVSYYRYSSDNQNYASIDAQQRAVLAYTKKNDIELVKEYIDEALTATTDDRLQFLQMISDISAGRMQVDLLLVHKLDRFARNRYDSAIYRHELKKCNVKLIAVDQPIDDSPEGIILVSLLEGMNEFYSANLSREVKKGMRENQLAAKTTGGKPPLGFNIKDGHYQINEAEAEIVKTIFQLAAAGESYPAITDKLNTIGLKSKLGFPFSKTSIHDILRNPKYGGHYVTGRYSKTEKVELPGVIPAIIPAEQWKEVQNLMDNRKHTFSKPKPGGQIYILTGKMECGICGGAYTGNSSMGGRDRKYRYSTYDCTGQRKHTCTNRPIQKEVIENYVIDEIERRFAENNINALIDMAMDDYQKTHANHEQEEKQIAISMNNIDKKMSNLLAAIEGGFMEGSIAGPRLNALKQERLALGKRLIEIKVVGIKLDPERIKENLIKNQPHLNDRSDMLAAKTLINDYITKVILSEEDIEITFKIPPKYLYEMVDLRGIEPLTSALRTQRSPS